MLLLQVPVLHFSKLVNVKQTEKSNMGIYYCPEQTKQLLASRDNFTSTDVYVDTRNNFSYFRFFIWVSYLPKQFIYLANVTHPFVFPLRAK